MKNKIIQICIDNNEKYAEKLILQYLDQNRIIFLKNKSNYLDINLNKIDYCGAAIILNSSGSKNIPKKCLHSIDNLNQSANASGLWLNKQGYDLNNCFIFNTLPLYHISGFMSLWRSKSWNCQYKNISPKLIKRPKDLFERTIKIKNIDKKNLITSLVPTQLFQLLSQKNGIKWLQLFDLIWVGGASISTQIINKCIHEKINLSPCYGATETAAMVSSLKPCEFLKRNYTSGEPLNDIKLRINKEGIVEIKTERIGIQITDDLETKDFTNAKGWWESGDYGTFLTENNCKYIKIIGRSDNAFNSGGEIIFPDVIQKRLEDYINFKKIKIEKIKISKINDELWGNRFIIFVLFEEGMTNTNISRFLKNLKEYTQIWPRHERPLDLLAKNKLDIEKNENWKKI